MGERVRVAFWILLLEPALEECGYSNWEILHRQVVVMVLDFRLGRHVYGDLLPTPNGNSCGPLVPHFAREMGCSKDVAV